MFLYLQYISEMYSPICKFGFFLPQSLNGQKKGPHDWYIYRGSRKVHNAEKRKVSYIQTNSAKFEGTG